MNPDIAIGIVYGLAIVGGWSAVFFLARAGSDWLEAKRSMNRAVPELRDAVRALKLKMEFLESDVKRIARFRDERIRRTLLDEPREEASDSQDRPPG